MNNNTNNNINIDAFGDWQRASNINLGATPPQQPPPPPPSSTYPMHSLNQIAENNRLNISNSIIYSKLEKIESDIEQIKNILLRIYTPQPINYQMQPSLFSGTNPPFMSNGNNINHSINNNQRHLF